MLHTKSDALSSAMRAMVLRKWPARLVGALIPLVKDLNAVSADGGCLFEALIGMDDQRIVELMLLSNWNPASTAASGWASPTIAVDRNALKSLVALLHGGVSPDIRNVNQTTALMIAGRQNNLAAMALLRAAKANPDLQDKDGWTAAHWTVHKGRHDTMKALEQLRAMGANLFARDIHGQTCFDLESDCSVEVHALGRRLPPV
jgi:hypothetical protein